MSARHRSTRSDSTHISVAIDEARVEEHGKLVGDVQPKQQQWANATDSIEKFRGEFEEPRL